MKKNDSTSPKLNMIFFCFEFYVLEWDVKPQTNKNRKIISIDLKIIYPKVA